jgi:GxxExxY protein
MPELSPQELSRLVSAVAAEVQQQLGGTGLEARNYLSALTSTLNQRGLKVERREIPPGTYADVKTRWKTVVELIVNDALVVEVKAEPKWRDSFEAEALSKLRLTGLKLALIINFDTEPIRDGIRRVVNHL